MNFKQFLSAVAEGSLDPKIKAATAKLKNQIQLGSVAADKAPRLELGVVGISIGQKQSVGDTSKV